MSKEKVNNTKVLGVKSIKLQEQNIVFHESDSTPLGKFFINKDGVFDFEGDCTESAKVFVREVKKSFKLK
tara:strand:- start:259 stop:468 length:210 start_codon:yes stop_codon:yes gene_type:complete